MQQGPRRSIDVVLFDYSGVMTTDFDVPTEGVPYDVDALFSRLEYAQIKHLVAQFRRKLGIPLVSQQDISGKQTFAA